LKKGKKETLGKERERKKISKKSHMRIGMKIFRGENIFLPQILSFM
jgi:hypothetical protein